MDTFYIIVLSIAVCLLILLLTFIGIKMTYNKRSNVSGSNAFPPNYSTCPDGWTADIVGNCMAPSSFDGSQISTDYNNSIKKKITSPTPGYISSSQINFQDAGWGDGTSRQCKLKDWANTYNIKWDGIINYNGCST